MLSYVLELWSVDRILGQVKHNKSEKFNVLNSSLLLLLPVGGALSIVLSLNHGSMVALSEIESILRFVSRGLKTCWRRPAAMRIEATSAGCSEGNAGGTPVGR